MKALVDASLFREQALELEAIASAPFTTFVYESTGESREIARTLWDRGAAEFAPPYARIALETPALPGEAAPPNGSAESIDGDVVGMLAVLDVDELARARFAATMELRRSGLVDPDGPVADRMALAAETQLRVTAEDLYLSRIAVVASSRGRGVGTWMLDAVDGIARARGKRRVVLEVSSFHAGALRIYLHRGFEVTTTCRAADPATSREVTYHHLAKSLP